MNKINIPPAALEAGVKAANELDPYYVNREQIRASFEAMVEAWEGMVDHPETASSPRCLWLPLTEKQDDKA